MPLTLLHGFTGGVSSWDLVRAHLPADCAVHAVVLPGHAGGTVIGPRTTFNDVVDLTAAALAGPAHVVGYSLGGRLALGLARRHTHLCASLTLISTHPGLRSEAARAERAAQDAAWITRLERDGLGAFLAAWETQPLFASQIHLDPSTRAAQARQRQAHTASGLSAVLRATSLARMPEAWSFMPRLPMPVHWVAGATDVKFCDLARQAHAHTPGSRLTILQGCGHNPLLEAPAGLAAVLPIN